MKKVFGIAVVTLFILVGSVQGVWAQEQKVVVSHDGTDIAYTVSGQGNPTLVFIHGWSCDKSYWDEQVKAFASRHKVITIDLAGHGDSSQDRSDYTMLAFGHDVKAVIDQESADKVVLIGHSMGGEIIAEAALLMPDKVIALIGADTLQNIAHPFTQEEMDGMLAPFQEDFIEGAKGFVKGMFPEDADPKLVEWVVSDMSSAPKDVAISALINYLKLYRNGDIVSLFEKTDVPVFAINARLWPTDVEENRKHMKSFDVLYVEDSGHFVMKEKPEEFNAMLRNILHQLEGER